MRRPAPAAAGEPAAPGSGALTAALAGTLAAALLAACASPGGLAPGSRTLDAAALDVQRSLDEARLSPGDWPRQDWWTGFGDPQLDALVADALAHSPSLREARARTERAAALAAAAGAALYPRVDAAADVNRQRYSANGIFPPPIAGAWYTQSQLSVSLSYEFDFWGRNRAALDAALGQRRAAEVDAFAARLLLAAGVAHAYVRVQRADDQLDVARDSLAQREGIVKLTRERLRAGLDSRIDLRQAEASVPAAREQITRLREERALACSLLAALLGAGPDRGLDITRPRMRPPPAAAPAKLPADLVGRRPDIVAERWRVEAAGHDIAAAKAAFYPNVNLAALVGVQSVELDRLLRAGSAIPLVDAAVRLPIFEGGRLRAGLAERDAAYDIAVEQYNRTVVEALREVVDQLTSLRSVDEQQQQVGEASVAAGEAYALAARRYAAGLGSYLQVLSAQGQVLEQQGLDADLRARTLDLSVDLIRALGGGFEQ